ncbi:hypothetical protein AGRA3207_007331 [Actinomadura graeca]|uniref:Uncharacterized protein n=1 Tax=Actinomadura graeca TaxID=2750812 RepID=A0ABX8R5I0_9ACTN|nr:hypothetical protein [Actinomadura graeca]QXJ25781.1 hypothetical protein AGRA3207_007331 [Actinomadura graeca]
MRIRKHAHAEYARQVVMVLADHFPELMADRLLGDVIGDAVARYAGDPGGRLECIVDSATVANWRLRPERTRPGRVRIACYRLDPTAADRDREQAINARLAQL